MSIILRPEEYAVKEPSLIKPFSGLCVCKAIEQLTGFKPSLTQMNDIYLNDKKICGILSEASSDFETGEIQYIVVGIGIHFNSDISAFPAETRKEIGTLFKKGGETISINQLRARIIDLILAPEDTDESRITSEYNKRMKNYPKN